jgi:hypothetical protein
MYHNQNTDCYTKRRSAKGSRVPVVGGAGAVVRAGGAVRVWTVAAGSEGGRGSKTRGVRSIYIHSDEEKISQCQTPGLVLQKKEGAAGGAAGRVETAGETALFNNIEKTHAES